MTRRTTATALVVLNHNETTTGARDTMRLVLGVFIFSFFILPMITYRMPTTTTKRTTVLTTTTLELNHDKTAMRLEPGVLYLFISLLY
jgi:hypothetical protein